MNALEVFLLTRIEEKGRIKDWVDCVWSLEDIGNFFLTPVRGLWHGRDVSILRFPGTDTLLGVHHVASFHRDGKKHVSRTDPNLHSSQSNWALTALSIVCLLPGLILGVFFKLIAHGFKSTRENDALVRKHFTPRELTMGSKKDPVTETGEGVAFLNASGELSTLNQAVSHLFITGKDLRLTAFPEFFRKANPEKIILKGAVICDDSSKSVPGKESSTFTDIFSRVFSGNLIPALFNRGRDRMRETVAGKLVPYLIESGKFEVTERGLRVYSVDSVEEAKEHTLPKRDNGNQYHGIYLIKP